MKDKIFNILSYFLPVIAGIIFVLFLIAFISTFISVLPIHWDFSNEGFMGFFKTFSSSLQLGASFLGVMAITLTLERMKQTKVQIDVMTDDNKFNNYFKHQDKFVEDLSKDPVINELHRTGRIDQDLLIKRLYYHFYYETYKSFSTDLNDEAINQKEEIKKLIQSFIRDNILEFTDVDRNILLRINKILDSCKYSALMNSFMESLIKQRSEPEEVKLRIKAGISFHFMIHFNKSVLSRIGENIENSKPVKDILRNYLKKFQITHSWGII